MSTTDPDPRPADTDGWPADPDAPLYPPHARAAAWLTGRTEDEP